MLKAAVIGIGEMGQNHARIYNEIEGVELVAVADTNSAARKLIEKKYRVKEYPDFRDLLNKEQPDLVSVVVPTVLHKEVALEVIKKGINLLVEKPLASDTKD